METRSRPLLGAALSVLCAAVPAAANADDPVPTASHALPPVSHTLPLVLAAGGETTGLVRIVNHSNEAGTVRVEAIDDAGVRFGPVTLELAAKHAVQLTSYQLETGNPRRGLPEGVGNGKGHWRLKLTSTLDIEPGAYVRTPRGFLTSMHDSVAEGETGRWHVPLFNPGSNQSRVSLLRLVNTSDMPATVDIDGVDDRGWPAEGRVRLTLAPRAARTVTARALESGGDGLDGRLGDGTGRWRLDISADQPLQVMNLLRSRSGHLTNLSTTTAPDEDLSITFVGCEAPEGFHAYLARGARAAGEDLGVDVTYVYPEEVLTPASQVRLIDDAIAAEADGIAVCAYLDDDEYRDVASRANASGVAFASAAAPPPGTVLRNPYDLFLFRTGADERAAGALTARQLLSMGVRGRVVLLNHRPNDITCRHRADSQREVLEKHGVEVALLQRDMDARGQSQALLGELQRHPDTEAATSVCAAPDPLLLVKAVSGREDLVITGYDLLGESVAAIRDGRQAFSIDQQPYWRGYMPVMLLTHYIRYGLQQSNHFLTGPALVDASNVEQVAALVEQGYR